MNSSRDLENSEESNVPKPGDFVYIWDPNDENNSKSKYIIYEISYYEVLTEVVIYQPTSKYKKPKDIVGSSFIDQQGILKDEYVLIFRKEGTEIKDLGGKYIFHLKIERGPNQGRVYVGAMNLRGSWAPAPVGTISVNATSCQGTNHPDRRDFSPMTPVDEGWKGFWNFEHYWQSGKVFQGIDRKVSYGWWWNQRGPKPKRKYPAGKGKRVLHAIFDHIDEPLDWVDSRKQVYVPEYYSMIKDREMTKVHRKQVLEGQDIIVYDMDGPRDKNGSPITVEISLPMLYEWINQENYPFGHGFVVAATLAGITPDQYV